MSIVVLKELIKEEDLELARKDYEEYVKVVVDIDRGFLAAGGEWHADAEKILLELGSKQNSLWGGGIDLVSGEVDYISLINTRPSYNNSQEVSDNVIRKKMLTVIKKIFKSYVRER